MKLFFCILALLCPYAYGLAQPIPPNPKGIVIGDTMPDVLLTNIYNHSLKQASFSALQKELTIIDFWASWCASCVAYFPKLHQLQKKYDGRLQVLMVNGSPGDDAIKTAAFFKRRKARTGNDFTLPYLLHDSILTAMFPHKTIPHCVWLDQYNKVIAITEGSAVTDENIDAVLNGNMPFTGFKNDALLLNNETAGLLPADAGEDGLLYRSIIMAGNKSLGSKVYFETNEKGLVKKLRVTNYSLLGLYQLSNSNLFSNGMRRLFIDSAASAFFPLTAEGTRGHCFSYELQTSPIQRNAVLQWMNADLERFFNIKVMNEQKMVPCYVLSAGANIAKLFTRHGKPATQLDSANIRNFIQNGSMDELRAILETLLPAPVVDETGVQQHIDIAFPGGFLKMNSGQIRSFLKENGIVLEQSERLLTITRLKIIQPFINQP